MPVRTVRIERSAHRLPPVQRLADRAAHRLGRFLDQQAAGSIDLHPPLDNGNPALRQGSSQPWLHDGTTAAAAGEHLHPRDQAVDESCTLTQRRSVVRGEDPTRHRLGLRTQPRQVGENSAVGHRIGGADQQCLRVTHPLEQSLQLVGTRVMLRDRTGRLVDMFRDERRLPGIGRRSRGCLLTCGMPRGCGDVGRCRTVDGFHRWRIAFTHFEVLVVDNNQQLPRTGFA